MPSESNFISTRAGESPFSPVLLHCWFTFNRCRYSQLYQRGASTLTVLINLCASDAHMLFDKYVNMGVLLLCCYLFYCPLVLQKEAFCQECRRKPGAVL